MSRLRIAFAAASICGLVACSDSTSLRPIDKIPDFVFVSNQTGRDRLYIYRDEETIPFPGTVDGDADPQSANGRIVFSSYRNGETNSEIYSAKLDGTDLQRLTQNGALDVEPSLRPDGSTIVFVSLQGGTSRLWMMNADGTDPFPIVTGSDVHTLESMPRFSPDGRTILFNSARTGTSQLWAVSAAGGAAVQVTHEINGAFDGSWDMHGASAFYIAGLDFRTVHEIRISDGTVTNYAAVASDVSQPACNAELCLVVSGASHFNGDILAYIGAGSTTPLSLLNRSANEREPAILSP